MFVKIFCGTGLLKIFAVKTIFWEKRIFGKTTKFRQMLVKNGKPKNLIPAYILVRRQTVFYSG